MTKTLTVSDSNHKEVLGLVGELQKESKTRVTINDVVGMLIKKYVTKGG